MWTTTGEQVGVVEAAQWIEDEFDKAVDQGVTGPTVETAGTQR